MSQEHYDRLEEIKIIEFKINTVIPPLPEEPLEGDMCDPNTPKGKWFLSVQESLLIIKNHSDEFEKNSCLEDFCLE